MILFTVILLLAAMLACHQPATVAGLPTTAAVRQHSNGTGNVRLPGRLFKNLCTDTRKFCNCLTTDTGLINHEYTVIDLAGQPLSWELLMEECIFESIANLGDGMTYR